MTITSEETPGTKWGSKGLDNRKQKILNFNSVFSVYLNSYLNNFKGKNIDYIITYLYNKKMLA